MARAKASSGGIRLLKRVLVGAAVGALLLTVIEWLLPRTYTSTAVILFPGAKGGGGATTGIMGDAGGGSGSADQPALPLMQGVLSVPQPGTSPATAGLILRSDKTTAALLERFDLIREWRLSKEKATERFHKRFVCSEGSSGDLRIAYKDRSATRARRTIIAALEMLTASIEELSVEPAQKNVAFLRQNLREAEANCDRIQKEIVRLQRAAGGTSPDVAIQNLGQLASDLRKELTTAEVEAAVAASSMKGTTEVAKKILATAQDPNDSGTALITTLYRDVAQKETELALLRKKFTDRRPEVVQAKQALEAARRSLAAETERQLRSLEEGASPLVREALVAQMAAQARAEGLRAASREVQAKLLALPATQARYTQLSADLRDERSRVSLLRSELARAQIIARTREAQFVILDPPTLPKRPDGYEYYWFTLAGALLGGLGTSVASLIAWARRSMREARM